MKPKLSLIAALSKNRIIGKNGQIPWHIPGEQKYFKEITTPHPIIMGRKTFDSIGRLLPNRPNIIISSDNSLLIEGGYVTHSLDEAINKAKEIENDEIFIIGGGKIFNDSISIADRLYLTIIHKEFDGDIFFPDYSHFKKVIKQENKEINNLKYSFIILEK